MLEVYAAIPIFILAAIIGLYLLSMVMRDKATPKRVLLIHGFFAALGIVLLIIYFFRHQSSPVVSLVLFIIAAMGGFFLAYRDITGRKIPKWFAIVHGLVAITGFGFLLAFAFVEN
jgi:hypothetical protein